MERYMMLAMYSLLFYLIPCFNTLDTIAPGKSITDPPPTKNNRNLNKKQLAGILAGSIMGMIMLGVTIYLWRKKTKRPGLVLISFFLPILEILRHGDYGVRIEHWSL
ncbi:hypothetical protein L6164_018532 [Bauhinia variegata]|uniref:Uncharacterized protein n=1 Tax=Bauhinia variegata TaxID=167791 RepID=A0ACB9NEZ0_BAUVA|nr:hypothetical protein L6164_018532 [Bauhinia variegata]